MSIYLKERLTKIFNLISGITIAMTLIGLVVLAYWLVFQQETITNISVRTLETTYHRGDTLIYELTSCKHHSVGGVIHRSLVDGYKVPFADAYNSFATGCKTIKITDLVVPMSVTPGDYYLEGTGEYRPNPIRVDHTHWKTNEFTILP